MYFLTDFVVCYAAFILSYASFAIADDDGLNFDELLNGFNNVDKKDVIDGLQNIVGTLMNIGGEKDGCYFTCPNGVKPSAKVGHKPKTNGCGSFGLKLDISLFPSVEKCCDAHDWCYDTCNRKKKTCDEQFKACLFKFCEESKRLVSTKLHQGCKSTADLMYKGTMALGCKPYRDSQRQACSCKPTAQRQEL